MSLKLEKAVFLKKSKKLKPLMKKDNYHNIFALLFDWLVIFGSAYLSITTGNIFVYLLSIILIGSRMRAFDNLMHEACHRSLFTNKFYNKWITCIFIAFPILQVLLHIVILTFNIIGIYGMKKMILIQKISYCWTR